MGGQTTPLDALLAEMAGDSCGVVTRAELLRAGVTERQIERRLQSGGLIREYPGVYRVGHRAPSVEARYLAAVRACGDGAVLCGLAAAYLLGLLRSAEPPPHEVLVSAKRRVKGVRVHRTRRLDPRDATLWRGIPVTSVPRTLVDLAAVLSPQALARACHEAGVRFGATPRQVEAVLARRPTSPGATKLRTIIRGETKVTLSALERRFLSLLREQRLPLPETNKPAGGRRVDCRWPRHRLTVELDSYSYHSSRQAWERDRRREREAYARGDQFRRYTYGDVVEDPRSLLRELRVQLPDLRASRTRRSLRPGRR